MRIRLLPRRFPRQLRTRAGVVGLCALAALGAPKHTRAADEVDPSAFLDAHAQAMGFPRELSDPRAVHLIGEVEGLGLSGSVEIWAEPPDRLRSRLDLGILKITQGFDGRDGWLVDRNERPRAAQASELSGMLLEAFTSTGSYALRTPPSNLRRSVGEHDGDPRQPEIVLQLSGAEPQIVIVDPNTLRVAESRWNNGQMIATNRYDDYRRVDGRWVAHRMAVDLGPSMRLHISLRDAHLTPSKGDEFYARPAETRARAPRFSNGHDSGRLSMQGDVAHILLEGVVHHDHPGMFLLDTGAGTSVLNTRYLPDLGLTAVGELAATGAAGEAAAGLVNIDGFRIGGMRLPAQSWVSLDLSSLEPYFGSPLLGVLGYDTIAPVIAEIDYEQEEVRFHRRDAYEPGEDAVRLSLRMDQNIPTLAVAINDIPAWVHVDTGSDNTLDLTAPFVRAHALLENREGLTHTAVSGLGGSSRAMRGTLESFAFAGFHFEDLDTNFNQDDAGVFGHTEIAGVLGAGLLSRFHCVFDYTGGQMWLTPIDDDARPKHEGAGRDGADPD